MKRSFKTPESATKSPDGFISPLSGSVTQGMVHNTLGSLSNCQPTLNVIGCLDMWPGMIGSVW